MQVLTGGRKKRMTKRIYGYYLLIVVILTLHFRALVFYKQIALKEGDVWQKMFSDIICRLLSSAMQ